LSRFVFCLFLGLALQGCLAVTGAGRAPSHSPGGLKVQAGDLLDLRFVNYPELSRRLSVDGEGRIVLAGMGAVEVAGKTSGQIERELFRRYAGFLAAPDIEVRIQRSAEFKVFVGGRVRHAGPIPFQPRMSVAQGLLQAGGFAGSPDEFEVFVFREPGASESRVYKIDMRKGAKAGEIITGFKLVPDDVVLVLKASTPGGRPDIEI